jgi:hypothetical protein
MGDGGLGGGSRIAAVAGLHEEIGSHGRAEDGPAQERADSAAESGCGSAREE